MKTIGLILASGVGSRLYPLSTEERPKQFLKLFKDQTMIQQTEERLEKFVDSSYIVTLDKYYSFVKDLKSSIILEEKKRESARSVLKGLEGIKEKNSIIIQTPSDHLIEEEGFKEAITKGIEEAKKGFFSIISVKPSKITDEFGYLKEEKGKVLFKQKPDLKTAERLIKEGYLWNTAIYIYQKEKLLKAYNTEEFKGEEKDFETFILQKLDNLKVIESNFYWNDLGNLKRLEEERKRGKKNDERKKA